MGIVIATSVLLVAAGLAARTWSAQRGPSEDSQVEADPRMTVTVAAISWVSVQSQVKSFGFLDAREALTLSAEVSGRIVEQFVETSDRVSTGQPLMQIDESLFTATHEKAKAEAKQAASDLHQAFTNLERIQKLEAEGSVNPTEVLDNRTTHDKALAMVERANAMVAEASIQLTKTTIRSPVEGVVSTILNRRGEYAHVGQPLLDVLVVDRLKVVVQVDDREIVHINEGDDVSLIVAALPDRTFTGQVLRIYPQAKADSRRFEVEIEVANSDGTLRPGFFAEIIVHSGPTSGESTSHLTIPRVAVNKLYGQSYCYVVRHDAGASIDRTYWVAIQVRPLLDHPEWFEVLGGVAAGDRVVVSGMAHVSDGVVVRVAE